MPTRSSRLHSVSLIAGTPPAYPVGMVRAFGSDALALAEAIGCAVDVGPVLGQQSRAGTVEMTPKRARVAMLAGRRVSLTVAANLFPNV